MQAWSLSTKLSRTLRSTARFRAKVATAFSMRSRKSLKLSLKPCLTHKQWLSELPRNKSPESSGQVNGRAINVAQDYDRSIEFQKLLVKKRGLACRNAVEHRHALKKFDYGNSSEPYVAVDSGEYDVETANTQRLTIGLRETQYNHSRVSLLKH